MPALTAAQMAGNYQPAEDWCAGCGLHHAAVGEHRPDCTVEPSPLLCSAPDCDEIRLPSERTVWQYLPNLNSYFCPTHHQKGTTA